MIKDFGSHKNVCSHTFMFSCKLKKREGNIIYKFNTFVVVVIISWLATFCPVIFLTTVPQERLNY